MWDPSLRGRVSTPRSSTSALKYSLSTHRYSSLALELYQTVTNTRPDDSIGGFCTPLRWGPPPPHDVMFQNRLRSSHKGVTTTVLAKLYSGIDMFFEPWPTVGAVFPLANHALLTPPLKYPLRTQVTWYGHRSPKETIVSLSKLTF